MDSFSIPVYYTFLFAVRAFSCSIMYAFLLYTYLFVSLSGRFQTFYLTRCPTLHEKMRSFLSLLGCEISDSGFERLLWMLGTNATLRSIELVGTFCPSYFHDLSSFLPLYAPLPRAFSHHDTLLLGFLSLRLFPA